MNDNNKTLDFGLFVNMELIPRLYEELDEVFPDMQFSRRRDRWESPMGLNGIKSSKSRKDKTVVYAKMPHIVIVNGEGNYEIVKCFQEKCGYNRRIDAVRALAEKLGVDLPTYDDEKYKAFRKKVEQRLAAIQECRNALFNLPEAKKCLAYLTETRGYTEDEIRKMGLGYINTEIARKYGIYCPRNADKHNQIVLPYESNGYVAGFKFRATDEFAEARWINTSFNKSNFLFGLSAIPLKGVSTTDRLVYLVDGELKALYMSVKGIENVVSGAGSDKVLISTEQIEQAKKKGVKRFVIIADNESTANERKKEQIKICNTLQMLNAAGLSGFVVYLPQADETKKEDVEDYIQREGIEALKDRLYNPEIGSAFRTRVIIEEYAEKEENGLLGTVQVEQLFDELRSLMKEYGCFDIASIKSTAKLLLKDISPEWAEAIDSMAEAESQKQKQQKKEADTRQLYAEIGDNITRKDYDAALNKAAEAKQLIEKENAPNFASNFVLTEKWSNITNRLGNRPIGIETLYKFKRGRETDLLTLPNGAITVIAAPTNHGKSTMLQNLAIQTARNSKLKGAILYFTFEEEADNVAVQFLSKVIGKPISRDNKRSIKSHYLGQSQYIADMEAFAQGEEEMKRLVESGKLRIFATTTDSGIQLDAVSNLKQFIKQATIQINRGVAAVFIDYVQLLRADKSTKQRYDELKNICSELRLLAIELSLPIVLAAQFSREGSKSPYEIAAEYLGEGGDIERCSNVIVGLWNTGKKPHPGAQFKESDKIWLDESRNVQIRFNPNEPKIYARILKGREGATGAEALLDCDLNVGIIYPNITRTEIEQMHREEAILPIKNDCGIDKEIPLF